MCRRLAAIPIAIEAIVVNDAPANVEAIAVSPPVCGNELLLSLAPLDESATLLAVEALSAVLSGVLELSLAVVELSAADELLAVLEPALVALESAVADEPA